MIFHTAKFSDHEKEKKMFHISTGEFLPNSSMETAEYKENLWRQPLIHKLEISFIMLEAIEQ